MQVLFVEDDAMNRRVVRDMLSVVGADMAEACDAESGLAMVDNNDYAIVLMDIRMPGMDGLTAVRHLRARADSKQAVPIIIVTADTGADLKQRCIASGADEVLQKPVAMGALIEAIGRLLAKTSGGIQFN